jgi:transcription elongation factor GreB
MRSMTCMDDRPSFAVTLDILVGLSVILYDEIPGDQLNLRRYICLRRRVPGLRFGYTCSCMRNNTVTAKPAEPAPPPVKNYMTPRGYVRLKDELTHLLDVERPELVKVISWAAGNGDRSENGDYIYGKKRLREIDRRIHYLGRRLDTVVVVDPAAQAGNEQIFFGATVTYADEAGVEQTVSIVGFDEVDPACGLVSWVSPIAKALLKRSLGDSVILHTPAGEQRIEIVDVRYTAP